MDGVKLLASILVCYPEIGTVSYEPKQDALHFSFALKEILPREQYEYIGHFVQESIITYHCLEGYGDNALIDIFLEGQGNTAFFHIIRDVATISQGEISMISAIMHDKLGNILLVDSDGGDGFDIEVAGEPVQEEYIDHMITTLKAARMSGRMIGVREEGRVMVFNK